MYYNPDSNAGGQYVTNTISFYEIQQAAREYDSAEDFFDYLGSIANQELADVGTEWFEDAESQFLEQPDFTDCSKTTMQSLVTVVSEVSVYNRETEILYSILDRLNIDDISLSYDENGLVAKDDNNEWHGAEFYHFLVDETFVFENDGSVLGIRPELLDDFKVLSEHNDVEVKDYQKKAPEEKSRDNIRQALQHKKVIKLADPIYDKTHIDNARTRKNSNLYITFENNLYILRGDTSHNGVTTKNMHLSTFHNIDDTVKYLIENNIKAIDYSVESSISDSEKHLYRNIDINDAILMHEHNFSVYRMDNTEVVINDEFWENPANYYQCKIDDYQQDKMIDAISSNIEKINEKFSLIAQEVGQPYYLDLNDYAENYDWDFDDGKTVYQNTALLLISNEYEPLTDYLNTAIAELENDFEYKTQYNLAVNTLEELESYIDKYSGQNVVKIEDDSLVIEQNKEQNTVNPVTETEKTNFDLKSFEIEEVGKKARFIRNINAIKVLKECENENRLATPDEQQILAQYVGWGGIPEAFDQDNTSWSKEFEQLKNLLTPQEYSTARGSTLTAFYTPQTVISAVYKALDNIGFKGGNILEPSCGTGHFIGMLPDSMQDSKFYGVELDTVSAGIAKQLYQKSSISAQPFEETKLPDSFFDAVIGNVPFGDFGVADKRYDKNHFLIHDYFFAKSLDKLRPGGVIAFITSKGTMDKENSSVRKYIAQRADLLGAIRLPNNTFKGNAGTEVVSDIIFLQKRDRMIDIEPDWVQLSTDEKGIRMNSYFVEHPEMILGEAKIVSGRFRDEVTYIPFEDSNLESQLDIAISNIRGTFTEYEVDTEFEEDVTSIPADPDVRNYSYTIVDDVIYFRENSLMYPETVSKTADSRIRGLIGVRDSVRRLIDLQTNDYPDEEIKAEQQHLNSLYDEFTEKYGLINSRANNSAFSQDSSYSLLSSLEVIDDDGNFVRKADIFSKRTIKPHKAITSVDTSVEALTVSISEKAKIDIDYMVALTGKSEEEIFSDLQGVIYLNPHYQDDGYSDKYISADEYLSGNVRQKLNIARECLKDNPQYQINVMALEKVQPKDLSASEISVRLGSTWIPKDVIEDYIYETLETPYYRQFSIKVNFVEHTGEWNITNKSSDKGNVKAYKTYGTSRVNGYKLIEDTLNLRDIKVFDYKEDADGKRVAVLNQKETTLAQSKQELIKQNFVNWIWKDPSRRERLCKIYNERFNSIRPREYDGSHITFYGINPEITLRKHQVNAIARILYGGNTLLAHTVGAGKTFEMVAAAMESKRLGLCSKSMFVVPNHLTEQWASEFLQLYPAANILVATKKDFEKKNRRRFCSRISTGDYDAVIIGHSQFEKIPMSFERQKVIIEQQIDEITNGILELKSNNGERFSIKQLEKSRKSLQVKLQKLNDQSRKDDVVTFEELGVDRLFVDESHYYKNLYLYTKMRNVGGIAQTEAQKSQDLFMKCRYLDEITDSKGIVFATGTPISNSMVELYTIQRYLQYNTLVEHNLQHFDAWASTFGETVSAIELNPEGTGYRAKTRFAKFFNLPELMNMFKEVADIQTADMLKLPVPKANYHNVAVKPSEIQTEMVNQLSKRADKVRSKLVDSKTDNMLKITNDGRKLALDQRIINPDLPDFENSKVNACAENIFRIWKDGIEDKTTQLVFCDLSTPNKDGRFNVYDDIKNKLIDKGIPAEEIQFIHDAKTETQKQKLFGKVRNGDVRILFGSTAKMGAGTNVQDRIVASHDIDCPWRPSDLEQRLGRTVRQGNRNKEVDIYRYVTEQTFDAYLYQLVEGKQKFASQIMTSKLPVRIAEDIDETALSYAEIKMLATGNPDIKEKMDLDIQVQKLNLLKSDYLTQKFELEDKIIKYYPQEILAKESLIEGLKLDIQVAKENTSEKFAGMTLDGVFYEDKKEAGGKLLDVCKSKPKSQSVEIGEYRGFKMILSYDIWERTYSVNLKKNLSHYVELSSDVFGNIQRLDNAISNLDKKLDNAKSSLENVKLQLKNAKEEVNKPFEYEDELNTKTQRLNELNAKLNLDANRADEPSEEEVFFKEVSTEQDKDTLISNGYDNYVKNDRGYIFKVAKSDKDKVEQLLAVNSKKMCI
ncbi:MAG: helicase-related protein [Ruminococcus sp.]